MTGATLFGGSEMPTWQMFYCPDHPYSLKRNNWCDECKGYVGVGVNVVPDQAIRELEAERDELVQIVESAKHALEGPTP